MELMLSVGHSTESSSTIQLQNPYYMTVNINVIEDNKLSLYTRTRICQAGFQVVQTINQAISTGKFLNRQYSFYTAECIKHLQNNKLDWNGKSLYQFRKVFTNWFLII